MTRHGLTDPFSIEIWNQIHTEKRNALGAVVGGVGTGKSILAIGRGEEIDPTFRPESLDEARQLIASRVVSDPLQFTNAVVNNPDLQKGTGKFLMVDEAGAVMPYEVWQSMSNRMISLILQTWRYRHLFVLFTLPSLKFLSVQGRRLLNFYIETKRIDFKRKVTIAKVMKLQPNVETGKIYRNCVRYVKDGETYKYDPFEYSLPNPYLVKAYEEKAVEYKHEIAKGVHSQLTLTATTIQKREQRANIDRNKIVEEVFEKYKNGEIQRVTNSLIRSQYPEVSEPLSRVLGISVRQLIEKWNKRVV